MEFLTKYRSKLVIKAVTPFISANSKVLDIGCGDGVISYEINKSLKCQLIGTDVLDYSKKEIRFKKMLKGDKLDFGDNEFDVAMFIEVLHHMPFDTQIKLIKEALRVSQVVLIFELKGTFLAKLADHVLNKLFHNPDMCLSYTHRSKDEWMKLFKEHQINYKCYDIEKPFIGFPFRYYLFSLTRTN